jgi:hypothetical protein
MPATSLTAVGMSKDEAAILETDKGTSAEE